MRKPSAATVIATVALFVALAGSGIAATGGNFILGQSNTAGAKTSLTAGINDKALAITNTNTGASASALGLTVASGHAPLTVNSPTRVVNLNADQFDGRDSTYFLPKTGKAADSDKLDGIDSTGFIQGGGRSSGAELDVAATSQHPDYAFINVPQLGGFSAQCAVQTDNLNQGAFTFTNTTAAAINLTSQGARTTSTGAFYPWAVAYTLNPGDFIYEYVSNWGTHAASQETWQLSPASGGAPIATVVTSIMFPPGECMFRANYTENG